MTTSSFRKVISELPHPDSLSLLERLELVEPAAMHGQPPVVWDKAEGFNVYDPYGNKFLDFSSGVLVANCGHNHPKVNQAIRAKLDQGLLTCYIFPHPDRVILLEKILGHCPQMMDQGLLFCSGSEAIEAAIKLSKNYASQHSKTKNIVVSFEGNFHGRTMGAQLAGGISPLKDWIGEKNSQFVQVPYPDPEKDYESRFQCFLDHLLQQNIRPQDVACVLFETYQGGEVKFAPTEYVQDLREWCTIGDVQLVCDEVQAGFGRTGKWWGFEHYGIEPDLIACGKGISSSLPLSAVLGSKSILNQFSPGAMSTTHSGNPLCCAAAIANIEVLEEEGLVQNSFDRGIQASKILDKIKNENPNIIDGIYGKGLVYAIHLKGNANIPASKLALAIVDKAISQGVMLFNPVGANAATIKINPPLTITAEALLDGLSVIEECIQHVSKNYNIAINRKPALGYGDCNI